MGEVYRAIDTRLGRAVAIKVLPRQVAENPARRQRFEREARALASLSHPHICPLYDVGEQDGLPFLVMEALDGETLAARLVRGALPIDQVVRHAIEMADALDHAHRQGVIHRDLKPSNVMLTRSGVKLLDFGVARLCATETAGASRLERPTVQTITDEETMVGTPQYMAPEQVEGRGEGWPDRHLRVWRGGPRDGNGTSSLRGEEPSGRHGRDSSSTIPSRSPPRADLPPESTIASERARHDAAAPR